MTAGVPAATGRLLAAGLAGALALNAVHEGARRLRRDAPRVDRVGERAVRRLARGAGVRPPRGARLRRVTLAGDVLANALYYALVLAGARRRPLAGGVLGGSLAGLGAIALSPVLGLGDPARGRTRSRVMTVAWYLVGGLVAALAASLLRTRAR